MILVEDREAGTFACLVRYCNSSAFPRLDLIWWRKMRLVETRKEEEEASWAEGTSGGSDISDTQTEAAVYVVVLKERIS